MPKKPKIRDKRLSTKVTSIVSDIVKAELAYLKKDHVLIFGDRQDVIKSMRYFLNKSKKPHITVLANSKKDMFNLIESSPNKSSITYVIANKQDTGLQEEEFDLIIAYKAFDRMSPSKTTLMLEELYRIAKQNCIVIITGNKISTILKNSSRTDFSNSEIITIKTSKYLKLIKLNEISQLPQ